MSEVNGNFGGALKKLTQIYNDYSQYGPIRVLAPMDYYGKDLTVSGDYTLNKAEFTISMVDYKNWLTMQEYYLTNMNFTGKLTVPSGCKVTFLGHTSDDSTCTFNIQVQAGGTLILESCTFEGLISVDDGGTVDIRKNAQVTATIQNYGTVQSSDGKYTLSDVQTMSHKLYGQLST